MNIRLDTCSRLTYSKADCSTGTKLPKPSQPIELYGMSCMCLCIMEAPLLNPELKNMKPFIEAITIDAALKSSMLSGSIYFSNSLVITITCWSHTENLLKIKL